MKYIHYSKHKIVLEKRTYAQKYGRKPNGLWFSVETDDPNNWDWLTHCILEEYELESLRCQTEIVVHSDANLLKLFTNESMRGFSHQYAYRSNGLGSLDSIDWDKVASEYQGIIISPFHRMLAFELYCGWYYGWDCECGCIWDLEAIAEVL